MKDEVNTIFNKKQKKLRKHFSAIINGQKVKILNDRIKDSDDTYRPGKVIELISKIKFPNLPKKAIINIDKSGNPLHIKGEWNGASLAPGIHIEQYFIIEEINN